MIWLGIGLLLLAGGATALIANYAAPVPPEDEDTGSIAGANSDEKPQAVLSGREGSEGLGLGVVVATQGESAGAGHPEMDYSRPPSASTLPKATLEFGRPTVGGQADWLEINQIMRRHAARLKYCYIRELRKTPRTSEDKIRVQFVIGQNGRVIREKILASTLDGSPVEACLLRMIRRVRFSQPKDGGVVLVTYPFSFLPGKPEKRE